MAETPYLNSSIVPFIEGQFPEFYRDNWPLFVAFLKAYYEYLESQSGKAAATYYTRNFLDLRDVDRTVDEFFVHLKTKYLNGIQLQTESDSRLLLKHAKDLYRAKGTPRGLQLFFRLLYDESISLYYPKDDILKMSSGVWTKPFYLEISTNSEDWNLVGKAIQGLTSGAQGFVDSVARKISNRRITSVAYISAVTGNFQTGEIIAPIDGSIPVNESPTIVGSMNQILFSLSGSGSGYSIGQILPVNSPFGVLGKARVTSVVDRTGLINANLFRDGYGYSNQSSIIISDTVMVFSNVQVTNSYGRNYVNLAEPITQPTGVYNFVSATGTITNGSIVQAWSNGSVVANAYVVQSTYQNSTAGQLTVVPISGNLAANTLYTLGNAISVSSGANGYVNTSSVGNAVGSSNLVLTVANQVGNFQIGEQIVQSNPGFPTDQSIQAYANLTSISMGLVTSNSYTGVFVPGRIRGLVSGATANVTAMALTVGVRTTSTGTQWISERGNYVYGTNMTANVSFVSSAITSNFGIAGYTSTETVLLNTDLLSPIANTNLLGPYGLAANATANSSTPLSAMLTFANVVVGQIANIYTITPGQQLDSTPMLYAVDARTSVMNDCDLTLYFANATASFVQGEMVTQANTGARGMITSINSSSLSLTNMRMNSNQQFVVTTSSNTTIVGSQSGTVANAVSIWADRSLPTGRDADIEANTVTAVNAVSGAAVVDSGFGYVQGETVWLGTGNTPGSNVAYGVVELQTAGTGQGFYTQDGGFMSAGKKFFDGDFYQEFSYEISSSHQLANYQDTLKKIMHLAGMKLFGRYVHSREMDTGISIPVSSFQRQA